MKKPNFEDGAKIIKMLQCPGKSSEEGRKSKCG